WHDVKRFTRFPVGGVWYSGSAPSLDALSKAIPAVTMRNTVVIARERRAGSALPRVVETDAVLAAGFDFGFPQVADDVLEGDHLAAAEQRHAVAEVQARRQVLADADRRTAQRPGVGDADVESDAVAELAGQQVAADGRRGLSQLGTVLVAGGTQWPAQHQVAQRLGLVQRRIGVDVEDRQQRGAADFEAD